MNHDELYHAETTFNLNNLKATSELESRMTELELESLMTDIDRKMATLYPDDMPDNLIDPDPATHEDGPSEDHYIYGLEYGDYDPNV